MKKTMRLSAFALGLGLALLVPTILIVLLEHESRLFIPAIIAIYGVNGAVLGFIYSSAGWRLGLWLVACWFLILLLSLLFAVDNVVWNTKRELQGLIGHLLVLVAACLGAEVGAIIRRWKLS